MKGKWSLGAPLAWLFLFFILPLGTLFIYSFLTKGPYGGIEWIFNFKNYTRLFDTLYVKVYLNSFLLASATTFLCLILGVPFAFLIVQVSHKIKPLLLFSVVLPFLSNFLVRTYAIKGLLGDGGWLLSTLRFIGIAQDDTSLSQGFFAVSIGLITNYLPLMVLPLYIGFEKFDFALLEAAKDLGAGPLRSFSKVFLPNVKKSLYSACFMVFVPALGEFLIPDLLGGARVQTLGKLISEQFLKTRDWPFGAALTFSMMVLMFLFFSNHSNHSNHSNRPNHSNDSKQPHDSNLSKTSNGEVLK